MNTAQLFSRAFGFPPCARLAGILGALALVAFPMAAQSSPPPGFVLEDVLLGIEQPIALRFLPDGRMLVLLKKGGMKIVDVTTMPGQADDYMDLAGPGHPAGIEFDQERGLLDVAIDPDFPSEPYVYLLYSPANGRLRVARFTHQENAGGLTSRGDAGSEVELWQDTDGYDSCCHFGGGLDFGPEGNLWVTTGDHFQGSYAASLQHSGGGVTRIEKDGSIPLGNPFVDGNGPLVDSLFAYGLRNPFRARWDLPTGRFLIAEVGGNEQMRAWEDLHVIRYDSASGRFVDGDFGTASDNGVYDGINFGWPTVEGLPPHTDFPAADIQPIGEPIFGYRHNGLTSAINGGVVYRGSLFPAEYQGAYFYADSTRDFVRYLKFNPDGSVAPNPAPDPVSAQNPDLLSYSFDLSSLGRIVCLDVGPDGALYYVSFTDSGGAYGQPNPATLGSIRRYVFEPGNARPVITAFTATPSSGPSPLDTLFSVEATDPESDAMSYTLDFGDGNTTSSQPLPGGTPVEVAHTYASNGLYEASVHVSDALRTTSETRELRVGQPPVITQFLSTNSRPGGLPDVFRYGDVITFAASAEDEDGTLDDDSYTWSIDFVRPGNTHPSFGPLSGTTSIVFPIPAQGQGFSGPVYYRCYLTVRDSDGLTTSSSLDIFPDKANIAFTTVPDGIPVQIDGNTTRVTPFVLDTLINYTHVITVPQSQCVGGESYDFVNWSNGPTTAQQAYTVPPADSALTAMYTAVGACAGPPPDGLVMHLDASTGLTLSGNTVISWRDETPGANELFSAGNPTRLPAEFNGQDAVHFDGIDAALDRTGFTSLPTGSSNRSLFLVGRYLAPNPDGPGWVGFTYGSTAEDAAFGLALTPEGILGVQGWGAGDFPSNPPTNGVGGLLSQGAVYEGGVITQFKNGIAIGTAARQFATGTGGIRLGEELSGGKNLQMDVAEVLVYDRAVTETERLGIEDYFQQRYQITMGGGNPPTVRITNPNNGSSVLTSDMPILLQGTATDLEDGDLGASISWSSSLDGELGTGANLSVTLSEGMHRLVATVEDSSLLQDTDEVDIVVASHFKGLITNGLVLHLESDQNVSTQAGDTVAGWLDGSGLGNDLVAGGAPELVPGLTPSGLPAIHLDGVDDRLERIHATDPLGGFPTGNADRTVFFLARYLGSSAWAGVSYGTAANNKAFGLIVRDPTGELVLQGYGSTSDLISATPGIGEGWLIQSGSLDDGVARLFRGGTQVAQWTHAYNTVLGRLAIGQELGNLGFVSADVAAVLVYDRALGDSERAGVESYLHDKYLAPNMPPVVSIQAPADGSTVIQGSPVLLVGMAMDKQDGDVSSSLEWSSDVDGALGTGASLSVSTLSVGAHVITATAFDSAGQPGSDTLVLSVAPNTPPHVKIGKPLDGIVHSEGTVLLFAATAEDAKEGDLSAGIEWSSDVDGPLGTGASLPVSTLSLGAHLVTASSTDIGGMVGTDTVTVTVAANTPPVVAISSPADGSSHVEGAAVLLEASSTDTEDGDLSAGIEWSSDVDGALGTGASLSVTTLSVGPHVLTASSTDSGPLVGMDTVSVTVVANTPPVVAISSPADGSSHVEGAAVLLEASSTDTEDGDLSAGIEWSSDVDGALGTGASLSVTTLSVGPHVLTASSTDSGALVGMDSVSVTVVANTPPVVAISSPADGSSHVEGAAVLLEASSTDTEDGDLSAGIEWSSDVDGALGTGASLSVTTLSVGPHVLTASSTDSGPLVGMDTVSVTVVANTPPVVAISSPADGSSHVEGAAVLLEASSTDTEDGDLSAGIEWSSDVDGALGTGASLSVTTLSLGVHVLTASSTDSGTMVGMDTVSVTVAANTPPVVAISSPADGSSHVEGVVVLLEASSTDTEDGDLSAGIEWSSDVDGPLGTGASLSVTTLSVGPHVLTASSTDSGPLVGMDSVAVMVVAANTPPVVAISSPADGSTHLSGSEILLEATATDAQDGDLSAGIVWASDVDGPLGSGASLSVTTLSLGIHVVTASSTDSGALVGMDSVLVTVVMNTPPVVAIASPVDGSTHVVGAAVLLEASSTDTEDGDLSGGIEWSSDVDGPLGTGASLSVSTLSLGVHVLTASSTDSGSLVGADAVTVTVAENTPPVVSISSPAEGSSHFHGAALLLTASSGDTEDGDLSDSIVWSSSRDGALGTGASLSVTTLSVGVHVLTASSTDSGGLQGTDVVSVRIEPNTPPLVQIITPLSGASTLTGLPVVFKATAEDSEDGKIEGVVWTSNLDGVLGTGSALQVPSLSIGTHVITATATDAIGLQGSAKVLVVVKRFKIRAWPWSF